MENNTPSNTTNKIKKIHTKDLRIISRTIGPSWLRDATFFFPKTYIGRTTNTDNMELIFINNEYRLTKIC